MKKKNEVCSYCDSNSNIDHHHTKYKEIHDEENIILLCRSCHKKLHNKLRKENKCIIDPKEIVKFSKESDYNKHYTKRNITTKTFNIHIDKCVAVKEIITYDVYLDKIYIRSNFVAPTCKNEDRSHIIRKSFSIKLNEGVSVIQAIIYNTNENKIYVNSRFGFYGKNAIEMVKE